MAGNDNYIGIAMGLDVTDLKSGLQETKKEISTANKEFKAVTAGMDNWTQSSEGLNAKLTQLDTILKNQRKQYDGIQAELTEAKKKYGENSEQVRRLNDQLLDVTASIGKTEKEQRKYTTQLEKVQSETKDTANATGKMSKGFKEANNSSSDLKGGLSTLKVAMGNLISTGISKLVSGLKSAVSESREFRKELAYLESGANDAGVSFDSVQDKIRDIYSITEDQGAGVEGLNNLMTAGFDGDALDKITDQLLGASIKWKDTLKFEGLADGLQETLATGKATGPFVELLERCGLVAEDFDAGLQACTTSAEKQNFVLQTLTNFGLENIKSAYIENNKSLVDGAKATYDYSKAQAEMGEKVEPVLNAVKMGFVDVLNAFLDVDGEASTSDMQASLKGTFQWFIETCVPAIRAFVEFFMKHWKAITVALISIGTIVGGWKVVKGISDVTKAVNELDLTLLKNVKTWTLDTAGKVKNTIATKAQTVATKAQTVAQKLLNTAMKANPILLIVSLIAMLVTAFITLWNTSEDFRNFWIGLWEKIKAVAKPVVDWLVKAFSSAWASIKKVWSAVVGFFQNVWDGVKQVFSAVVSFYTGIFTRAWDAVKSAWSGAVNFFAGIWASIKNAFANVVSFFAGIFASAWSAVKGAFGSVGSFFAGKVNEIVGWFGTIPDKLVQVGRDMMSGLINGVKSMAGTLKDAVVDTVMGPVDYVKDALGIHSPSTLMRDEIGKMMGEGVGEGLIASLKGVLNDAKTFTDKVTAGLSGSVPTINAGVAGMNGGVRGGTTITNNYVQTINAPKQPSRLELYRQTKNLLSLKKGD